LGKGKGRGEGKGGGEGKGREDGRGGEGRSGLGWGVRSPILTGGLDATEHRR